MGLNRIVYFSDTIIIFCKLKKRIILNKIFFKSIIILIKYIHTYFFYIRRGRLMVA